MAGVGGLNGWRWIFILEGIATVVVGVTLPWTLPDSPESASFLTPEEKALIKHRLEEDSGTAAGRVGTSEGFQWKYLIGALTEWYVRSNNPSMVDYAMDALQALDLRRSVRCV